MTSSCSRVAGLRGRAGAARAAAQPGYGRGQRRHRPRDHVAPLPAVDRPLLLLLGSGGAAWAQMLAGLAAHSARRMLVAVAAEQWAPPERREPSRIAALPPDELSGRFRTAGWRVARLERDSTTATAWAELGVSAW